MEKIVKQGQLLFAIAITAFGIQHLIWPRFGQAVVPVIPWVPGNPFLAYLTGIVMIAAGLSIVTHTRAQLIAILLGILFLLAVLLLWVSRVAASPLDLGIRTRAFETLAMGASALMLAGTLPAEGRYFGRWENAVNGLVKFGRFLFAASSVVFGIDHFLVLAFIASLVPAWIPGGLFWAYLTGAGFIAAGVCIATKWMDRWAAMMLGTMFLLWFLLLHAPRVMSAPRSHDPNEWCSAFIALAMCGGAWVAARDTIESRDPLPGV